MIEDLFKRKKLKLTKQRKEVLDLINILGDNATLKNITLSCCSDVDKSTIYRIINFLLKNDIISKDLNCNNEVYYLIKEEHQDYFTCVVCHKKEKIDSCPLSDVDNYFENKKGYKIMKHSVSIQGVCSDCMKKGK